MAKARTKQTDHQVSMEDAMSVEGKRRALARQRGKAETAAMRETLKDQARTKGSKTKAKISTELKKLAAEQGPHNLNHASKKFKEALRYANPTFKGMDVIPEHLGGQQPQR